VSGDARPPAWAFPPERTLGVGIALNVVLARGASAAMVLTHAVAFPDGVVLDVLAVRREAARHVPWDGDGPPPDLAFRSERIGSERLDVRFDDGRRSGVGGGPDGDIALTVWSALSGSWHRDARLYLWPLPPPGPLTLTVAWEEVGIPDTTVAVDTAPLRAAAERAVVLWPED
jgi:hypothetical protein